MSGSGYASWDELYQDLFSQTLDIARAERFLLAQPDPKAAANHVMPGHKWAGRSVLHEATRMDNAEFVEILLRHGADTSLYDSQAMTPVSLALACCALNAVWVLGRYEKLPDLNVCGAVVGIFAGEQKILELINDGRIAHLYNAPDDLAGAVAARGSLAVLRVLISRCGCDVNGGSLHLVSPFVAAIVFGQTHVVRFLLEGGYADLSNRKDPPLERAIINGNLEVIDLLREHGADFLARPAQNSPCETLAEAFLDKIDFFRERAAVSPTDAERLERIQDHLRSLAPEVVLQWSLQRDAGLSPGQ